MNEHQLKQLNQLSAVVQTNLPQSLVWQTDNRFDALIAEIPKPKLAQVKEDLAELFEHAWDKKTIRQAPSGIKRGSGVFSQMETGQLLFTHHTLTEQTSLMAAWWPWGPGAPASLRLFIADTQNINQPDNWLTRATQFLLRR